MSKPDRRVDAFVRARAENRPLRPKWSLHHAWSLKGSYVETYSRDLICPCNATFDHGAKYDYCRVTLGFSIREDEVNERTSGGLRIAAIADTPKVMTEGNWRLGVFVDDRATDDQAEKLIAVFTGRLGGPMAGIAPLVGEMCLGKCRSPLGFLLGAWRDGRRGALRMGVRHGAWCVGCRWALMASLFALGLMSLVWIAFVLGLIAVEKVLPWRRVATYGTGAVLLVLGVLMLAAPDAIPALTIPGSMSEMG